MLRKLVRSKLTQELKANSDLPIIEIVPHNNKLTQNCSDLAGLFCRTKRYGFEYEILMFPEARYDDQVDSTVQYLQWMRKTNTSAFRVRPNPT
ncbi:hypothetical protein [Wolbachia endosymbiont (group A) of Macropis europaea]